MIREYDCVEELPNHIRARIGDNLFFSKAYETLIEEENKNFLILADNDYAMPVALFKKFCFVQATLLYQPLCINGEGFDDGAGGFLDECVRFLSKKKRVQYILPNPAYTEFISYPKKSKRIPFGNYVCHLEKGEEELFAGMHSKHRNSVRKAQKDGVVVKSGKDIELISDYVFLDEKTWERSSRNSSGENFYTKRIKILPDNCMIFVAYKDEEPQSAAFIYYDSECGYYMFGANLDRPYTGAGNLLQWEIMRFLMNNGVKYYSFVGCRIDEDENSKYHNIQRFKSRFGGELRRGYMFKVVCNPIMHGLFRCVLRLKGRKITEDAIDQEIGKWKDLN